MSLRHEAMRKTWHMLTLLYLAAYRVIGYPRVLWWLAGWTVFVAAVDVGRLYLPALNRFLFSILGTLSRPTEQKHASGMIHSALGVLLVVAVFGTQPRVVSAAIWCVAVGDAAAALVGKAYGRTKLVGKKSLEGSLGCLAACLIACLAHGFSPLAAGAAALAATLIELAPTSVWLNDNLWMPVGAALALSGLA
jgi:dolichol kinase